MAKRKTSQDQESRNRQRRVKAGSRALKKLARTVGKAAVRKLTDHQKSIRKLKRSAKTVGNPVSNKIKAKILARGKSSPTKKVKISASKAKAALSPHNLPKKSTAMIAARANQSKKTVTGGSKEFRRHFAQGLKSIRNRKGRDAAKKVHAIVTKRAVQRGSGKKTFSFISASGVKHTRNL